LLAHFHTDINLDTRNRISYFVAIITEDVDQQLQKQERKTEQQQQAVNLNESTIGDAFIAHFARRILWGKDASYRAIRCFGQGIVASGLTELLARVLEETCGGIDGPEGADLLRDFIRGFSVLTQPSAEVAAAALVLKDREEATDAVVTDGATRESRFQQLVQEVSQLSISQVAQFLKAVRG